MFFGIIWIVCFISAKTNFVTMMSVCTYYFSIKAGEDKKDPEADVGLSLNREEASLAADFTSLSIDNISAVIHIIQ